MPTKTIGKFNQSTECFQILCTSNFNYHLELRKKNRMITRKEMEAFSKTYQTNSL